MVVVSLGRFRCRDEKRETTSSEFVHPLTDLPLTASDLLTQKGVAVLRSGEGATSRGVTMRFGPTLNHGHLDEMGINIYARGNQLTYDLGYGLGSTHTQVGWSYQTASHCTVLVNEKSQIQSGGAGGSAELFVDLPGVKIAQADDPLCYLAEKVSRLSANGCDDRHFADGELHRRHLPHRRREEARLQLPLARDKL